MTRCSGQDDQDKPSSSFQKQQPSEHHNHHPPPSSSSSSDTSCAWLWKWMIRASSPSTESLMMYPSCGGEEDDDDHDAAVVAMEAVSATSDESPLPTITTAELCATTLDFQDIINDTATSRSLLLSTMTAVASCGEYDDTYDATTRDHHIVQDDLSLLLQTSLATLLHQEVPFKLQFSKADDILGTDGGASTITMIRHVAQRETWDCGVACMQMIFDWLSRDHDDEHVHGSSNGIRDREQLNRDWMLETLGTTSIWTIDLVCLLEKILSILAPQQQQQHQQQQHLPNHDSNFDTSSCPLEQNVASYLFLSKTLGVNDAHSGIRYYQRAFLEDQRRVEVLFQRTRAQQCGKTPMPIVQYPHLSLNIVRSLVSRPNCIAMVLVDNSLLMQQQQEKVKRNGSIQNDTYQGHYVLLCGICQNDRLVYDKAALVERVNDHELLDKDEEEQYCFALMNPARSEPTMEFVSPRRFERAWRATGTDDDIVFIVKHTC